MSDVEFDCVDEAIGSALIVSNTEELMLLADRKRSTSDQVDFSVETQASKAVKKLRKLRYHAVITDLNYRKRPGYDINIIAVADELGIPSILVSGDLTKKMAKGAANQGASKILELPASRDRVVQLLADVWANPVGLVGCRERFFDCVELTATEKKVGRLLLKGLSNKEIASALDTSVATVKVYTNKIYSKSDVSGRAELFSMVFPT